MPVILTSRADEALARPASCAIALLLARRGKGVVPRQVPIRPGAE